MENMHILMLGCQSFSETHLGSFDISTPATEAKYLQNFEIQQSWKGTIFNDWNLISKKVSARLEREQEISNKVVSIYIVATHTLFWDIGEVALV